MNETHSSRDEGLIWPGELFVDDHGAVAQLHGVGIQRIGNEFVAWGENKVGGNLFGGVSCYASADLASWRYRGEALAVGGHSDLDGSFVVERPKVITRGDKYVMYVHVDSPDYSTARVGTAESATPWGPFSYRGSFRPLGNESRDIGIFVDSDESAYLLSEDRGHGLRIYRLSDDGLSVEELVATLRRNEDDYGYESPALVNFQGIYYLFGSDLTGWSTNDNKFCTAKSLGGPWSDWRSFAPIGTATFDSQVSSILHIGEASNSIFVYVGDRWNEHDLGNSAPVWLPMRISDRDASIEWTDAWSLADLSI